MEQRSTPVQSSSDYPERVSVDFRATPRRRAAAVAQRVGTLLVPVPGLSGTTYPPGTTVVIRGRGAAVDAFVGSDWLPLAWWEFSEGLAEDAAKDSPSAP
jgi:hypothetical protein